MAGKWDAIGKGLTAVGKGMETFGNMASGKKGESAGRGIQKLVEDWKAERDVREGAMKAARKPLPEDQAGPVLPSYRKGGRIPRTGAYKLHKGEVVIPAKEARKMKSRTKSRKCGR